MANERQTHNQQEVIEKLRKQVQGGGPSNIIQRITASELAAGFSESDALSMIKIKDLKPGNMIEYAIASASTLDGDMEITSILGYAYKDGASTEDVYNLGESISVPTVKFTEDDNPYTNYSDVITSFAVHVLKPGAVGYILFNGSIPPTEGEITIFIAVRR